jgi:serine/threonine protein kinase
VIAEKNPIAPEQIERAKAPTRDMLLGDRYRLEVILGEGGMGHVWAARDLKLDRPVAIKLLPEDMLGDTRRALRFAAEARFAGRVSHPNILTLHDASTDGDRPYLVFERLEGTSLREQMQRPLSVDQATIFACWIARGLAAAHKKAIVHRDLKPENIFVTSDGWLKILDFGVAKELTQVAAGGGDTLTSDGGFVGTVGYASPEQLRGEPLSPAADLFSFGCVLHEMLRDELPFVGETRAELARATLSDAPHSLPAWVSPTLVECVARCLEKDPAKRPRADALADLLAQGVEG